MPVLHVAGSLDAFWALLDAWCDNMAARELTPETIEQRESYLVRFFRRTRTSPETLTSEVANRFIRSVTPRSSKREAYVYAARTFYRFALSHKYLEMDDPTVDLRARSPKYEDPDYYPPEEVQAILRAAKARPPAKRYWTILLLFETGGRIGSVAAVRPEDTGTQPLQKIRFRVAKNDRPYAVELTPAGARAVRELLALREGRNGTLVERHPATIGDWFRESARDAGLPEGRVNAHLARHTFATVIQERMGDVLITAKKLNHADVRMTMRYAAVVARRSREAMGDSITGDACG